MAKFNLDNYETVEEDKLKVLERLSKWKNRNRSSTHN